MSLWIHIHISDQAYKFVAISRAVTQKLHRAYFLLLARSKRKKFVSQARAELKLLVLSTFLRNHFLSILVPYIFLYLFHFCAARQIAQVC